MTKSLNKIIEHIFIERDFNRIELQIINTNQRCINLAEKLGFKLEGQLKKAEIRDNEYFDILIYGLLKKTID